MALKKAASISCLFTLLGASFNVNAQSSIPEHLSVIGFNGESWSIYISRNGGLKKLDKIADPRSFSYDINSGSVAYIGSDANLHLHQLSDGTTRELGSPENKLRYTQPFFSYSGEFLYIVQLPEGKSRRTEIVALSMIDNKRRFLVRKRTAQFEPYSRDNRHLYYSTAICVDDCEGMIWELWHRDSLTARQYQLTLLNHVSNQPHLSEDNWLYFSSNAPDGYYHIWRMRPDDNAAPEQLTFGKARDSEPFTDKENMLYFIRKTPQSTRLMIFKGGKAIPVSTPEELVDFRNLEIR